MYRDCVNQSAQAPQRQIDKSIIWIYQIQYGYSGNKQVERDLEINHTVRETTRDRYPE